MNIEMISQIEPNWFMPILCNRRWASSLSFPFPVSFSSDCCYEKIGRGQAINIQVRRGRALAQILVAVGGFAFSFPCSPDSSLGKESSCDAEDPGLIPGSGGSAGEGKGYPLQYTWASLVAQVVKNLPTMRETWFQSLGWEDPLEKGKATHSSVLAWRIPWII